MHIETILESKSLKSVKSLQKNMSNLISAVFTIYPIIEIWSSSLIFILNIE